MDNRVLELAEAWIGTPYLHQESCRGIGADCLGLICGIWRDIYGEEPEALPAYTDDWFEFGGQEVLLNALARHMIRVSEDVPLRAGQVLLFRMRAGAVAKHLGICAGEERFVHAYCGHGVIDSPLSRPWRRRITARFRFPLSPNNH